MSEADAQPPYDPFTGTILLALGLFILAAALRISLVPGSFIGADSIDPFWRSWRMLQGDPSPPLHVPESGYGLYISLLPAFIQAHSLEEILRRGALLHALAAPLLFLGMVLTLPPLLKGDPLTRHTLARGAALGAGLILALSGELLDTPIAGARTYLALPFTTALTIACLATLGGRPWGLYLMAIASPFALMNHPFALPMIVALIPILWGLRQRFGLGHWLSAALLGGAIAAPRAWQLLGGFFDRGAAHGESLVAIATSNSMGSGILAQLRRSLGDAFFVGSQGAGWIIAACLGGALILMALGLFRRSQADARALGYFGAWVALSLGLFGALALSLGYVQHYHLRPYLPAISAAGFLALALLVQQLVGAKLMASALLRGGVILLMGAPGLLIWDDAAYGQLALKESQSIDRLSTHRDAASRIFPIAQAGPVVLDALHIDTQLRFFTPAVALDLISRGVDITHLPTRPERTRISTFCVALVGPKAIIDTLAQLPGAGPPIYSLEGQQLEGERPGALSLHCVQGQWALAALGASICANLPPGSEISQGSTYNYMGPLDSELRSEWVGAWWPSCLGTP